jgi:DDE superfamily endonuclease
MKTTKHRLILPMQAKGNMGKSIEATARACWLNQRDIPWQGFDLDGDNRTLSRLFPGQVLLTPLNGQAEDLDELISILRKTTAKPVNGYEREFRYVYGAVSPLEGELDLRICPVMNTEQMRTFLAQVSAAHPDDFIVMVVDGASSHVANALGVPENIRLHRLPGYSPGLNPQEHLWDEIREKEFPNRVFSDMARVARTLETGLPSWLRIATGCAASALGLGLLVST